MKIYIAAPYTALTEEETVANVYKAIDVAALILQSTNHSVYVPHLSHFIHKREPMPYYLWIQHGLVWLDACDVVLFLEHSPEADLELEYAIQKSKRVYYAVGTLIEDLK